MIPDDRELLAELSRLTTALAPPAMRIMDGIAGTAEHRNYARRMIAAGERLRRRAERARGAVMKGEVLAGGSLTLPVNVVEPYCER